MDGNYTTQSINVPLSTRLQDIRSFAIKIQAFLQINLYSKNIVSCNVLYQSRAISSLANSIRGFSVTFYFQNLLLNLRTTPLPKQPQKENISQLVACDFNETPTNTQVVAIRYRLCWCEMWLFYRSFGFDPPSIIVRVNPGNSESIYSRV